MKKPVAVLAALCGRALSGLLIVLAASAPLYALPVPELDEVAYLQIICGVNTLMGNMDDLQQRTAVTGREDIAAFLEALKAVRPSQSGYYGAGVSQVLTLYSPGGEALGTYALSTDNFWEPYGARMQSPVLLAADIARVDVESFLEHPDMYYYREPESLNITAETVPAYRGENIAALYTLAERFLNSYAQDRLAWDTSWHGFLFHEDAGVCARIDDGQENRLGALLNSLRPVPGTVGKPLSGVNRMVQLEEIWALGGINRSTFTFYEGGIGNSRNFYDLVRWDRTDQVDSTQYGRLRENAEALYREAPKYAAIFFSGFAACDDLRDVSMSRYRVIHGKEAWETEGSQNCRLACLPVIPESRRAVGKDTRLYGAYRVGFSIGKQQFDVEMTESAMIVRTQGKGEYFRFSDREAAKAFIGTLEERTPPSGVTQNLLF